MTLREKARRAAALQREKQTRFGSPFNKSWQSRTGLPAIRVKVTSGNDPRCEWRIVPYTMKDPRHNPDCGDVGGLWYKRRFWTHKVGPQELRVCCPQRTFGLPCPVCDRRAYLKAKGASMEELAMYSLSERELFNIWDLATNTVGLLEQSTYLFGDSLNKEANDPSNADADAYVEATKEGKILSIRFDVSKFKNAPMLGNVQFKDAKAAIPDEIMAKAEDLDACLICLSSEELIAMMDGDTIDSSTPSNPPAASSPTVRRTEEVSEHATADEDLDEDVEDFTF